MTQSTSNVKSIIVPILFLLVPLALLAACEYLVPS